MADVVLNQLYRYTPLQTSFGANMVALNGGRPELMTLKDLIKAFVDFREEVVSRRTKYLLNKARERAHVLVRPCHRGRQYRRGHPPHPHRADPNSAREALMGRDWPAQDIAPLIAARRRSAPQDQRRRLLSPVGERRPAPFSNLRLQRLTALGRDEIGDELQKLAARRSPIISRSCARALGS